MAAGILLTRGLVASPANYLTPTTMAETAQGLADAFPTLSLKVLEQDECAALGMGAYLGVSQGAIEPPKFIHLTHTPAGGAKKKVCIVGKGLTFDSGGYNIKAGAGSMIEKMKFDMGGAGAVLGAARSIGELAPADVEVHFIIAACENMVSAEAMRPGDILTASNGKTIEVLNTDAEGRLTLADALVYADGLGDVDAVIDIATLTGACIVALGPDYGAVYTDEEELLAKERPPCNALLLLSPSGLPPLTFLLAHSNPLLPSPPPPAPRPHTAGARHGGRDWRAVVAHASRARVRGADQVAHCGFGQSRRARRRR